MGDRTIFMTSEYKILSCLYKILSFNILIALSSHSTRKCSVDFIHDTGAMTLANTIKS